MNPTPPPLSPGLYRSRSGWFLGVCQGIADWRDIGVGWIRLALIVIFVLTGFWPTLIGYVIIAFILKAEPVLPPATEDEREFYDAYANSRTQGLHRLKRTFDHLDRRMRRMEDVVTSREFDWERRMGD